MLLGALFCLLGTVALVAIAFVGFRWLVDRDSGTSARAVRGGVAEHSD
jgi:hypothetical protein